MATAPLFISDELQPAAELAYTESAAGYAQLGARFDAYASEVGDRREKQLPLRAKELGFELTPIAAPPAEPPAPPIEQPT